MLHSSSLQAITTNLVGVPQSRVMLRPVPSSPPQGRASASTPALRAASAPSDVAASASDGRLLLTAEEVAEMLGMGVDWV